MTNYITSITAEATFGQKGAYVARLTGVDPKYGFAREFLSREPVIMYPGLYETCSVYRRGRKEVDHWLVFGRPQNPGELHKVRCARGDAAIILATGRSVDSLHFRWLADPEKEGGGEWAYSLTPPAESGIDRASLEAERAELTARLAEIDAALATPDRSEQPECPAT